MKRPHIICHMVVSLDGKVTGDFLSAPECEKGTDIYYEINRNFAADAFSLATMIANGELPGMGLIDIPYMISVLLTSEPEYLRITISNILMGLLFAGLGVFSLLRKTGKEVSATKVIDLE